MVVRLTVKMCRMALEMFMVSKDILSLCVSVYKTKTHRKSKYINK